MVPPTSPARTLGLDGPPVTGICICTHYVTEHDERGQCLASDLFGTPCDCPGYEPDESDDDE